MSVILVGFLVLVGWMLDIPALKSVFPGLVTMKANTALAFLFAGLSLWLLQVEEVGNATRRIAQACAGMAALIGLLTLVEYLAGWDFGIDELLFPESMGAVGTFAPGRMAPTTALNFLLTGGALLLLDTPRGFRVVEVLTLTAGVIGTLNLMGYAYGVKALYGLASYTQMALHTAVAFVVLSLSLLFARPDRGLMAMITSDNVGSVVARRLFPVAIGVPFLVGWLRLMGERAGLYDREYGAALLGLANMIILGAVVWWNADLLYRTDSERKRREEEVQKLNEDLTRRGIELGAINKELESFSYSVSHDLRAPLRSIDGFSQALVEDYPDTIDAQGKDYLQRVRAASQRMGQLIDDLLSLARITRSEMRREGVDLSALAQAIAGELQETQSERQVEFVIAQGMVATGDARLLRIVLENLLGNAWKFTGKRPRARIELGVTQDDGHRVYFVRDDGAGFDMAYANKIFGAFQRLHAMTEFSGTGIGLATVQRIIHRHGGRIWAEAAVGQGATFYFTL